MVSVIDSSLFQCPVREINPFRIDLVKCCLIEVDLRIYLTEMRMNPRDRLAESFWFFCRYKRTVNHKRDRLV